MGQPSSNIARAGTGSVEYAAEADLETALGDAVVDEVTTDGDVADVHTETMSLTGSMFRIQIAVSLHKSRKL
jgi:hypothetical protein